MSEPEHVPHTQWTSVLPVRKHASKAYMHGTPSPAVTPSCAWPSWQVGPAPPRPRVGKWSASAPASAAKATPAPGPTGREDEGKELKQQKARSRPGLDRGPYLAAIDVQLLQLREVGQRAAKCLHLVRWEVWEHEARASSGLLFKDSGLKLDYGLQVGAVGEAKVSFLREGSEIRRRHRRGAHRPLPEGDGDAVPRLSPRGGPLCFGGAPAATLVLHAISVELGAAFIATGRALPLVVCVTELCQGHVHHGVPGHVEDGHFLMAKLGLGPVGVVEPRGEALDPQSEALVVRVDDMHIAHGFLEGRILAHRFTFSVRLRVKEWQGYRLPWPKLTKLTRPGGATAGIGRGSCSL